MHFIFSLLMTLNFAGAQTGTVDPRLQNPEALKQEGQLFSIQLVPDQPVKIFVVGREEAHIDFKKLKLTVRRLSPGASKTFHVAQENDYFKVAEPLDFKKPTDLEIKATNRKGKSETFHFKINQRLH